MADEINRRDKNYIATISGIDNSNADTELANITILRFDQTTKRLLVDSKITDIAGIATSANQTNGDQKIQITDSKPTGHSAYIDHFHNLQTSEMVRLVGTTFNGTTKDTNFWTEAVTGTGSAAQSNALIVLQTGATANSTASYATVRKARFVTATTHAFRWIGKFSNTGSANNIRQFGMYDANDGLFFQLNGTTLNIVTRAAGSDTAVAKASWNVSTSFTLDTNIHAFEIRASYQTADFYIDDQLVHSAEVSGSATLKYNNLSLPAAISNANSGGGTADVTISTVLCCIFRVGKLETASTYKNIKTATTTVCKYGAGMLHKIVLNNPTNSIITVYDNTAGSGTEIAIIAPGASATPVQLNYDVGFSNGLTIVTAGTPNITVIYE